MYEEILTETAKILKNYKNGIGVYLLWKILQKQGKINKFKVPKLLSDFVTLIEGDKRYLVITPIDTEKIINEEDFDLYESEEMVKLNVNLTQIVKLNKSSILDDDEEEDEDIPSLAHSTIIANKMKKNIKAIKNRIKSFKSKKLISKKNKI